MTRAGGPLLLHAGAAHLAIDPAQGGRFTSLVVGGQELLVTEGYGPIRWGCYPMAPFAGRIRDGRLTFRDREHELPRNLPPHAIHGTVLERAWDVTGPGELTIDLGDTWPFAGRVIQRIELREDGLDATLTLLADEPMPVSMGWHPWFRRHLAGTVDHPLPRSSPVELAFVATTMLERGADGLPTGRTTEPGPHPWDDCFTGLRSAPRVTWPGILDLELTSNADYWVVYDEPVEGICVEPQTQPPDFVNLAAAAGREPPVAAPDHPASVAMSWRWRTLNGGGEGRG